MSHYTPEQTAVSQAGRNRMQIRRQYGLSFQAVEVVLKLANLRAFGKPRASQSDVARVLGIDRSRVCQHLKKAEAVGLLVRVGRTYFFRFKAVLSVVEQGEISRKAAAMKRAFVRKVREIKRNLGFVADCATDTPSEYLEQAVASRSDHLAALSSMYIPLHLRKSGNV